MEYLPRITELGRLWYKNETHVQSLGLEMDYQSPNKGVEDFYSDWGVGHSTFCSLFNDRFLGSSTVAKMVNAALDGFSSCPRRTASTGVL